MYKTYEIVGTVIKFPCTSPSIKSRNIKNLINYQPIFIISIIQKIY